MVCCFLCENGYLLSQLLQSCDVLAENVELDVDDRAHPDVAEIGVLHGVGDDGHLERVLRRVADGQRHAVDGDRTLVDREVAAARHGQVVLVFEGEVGTAVGVFHGRATSSLIDVALHDVAVQAAVHLHRPLHVHLVAHVEQAEVRAFERLLHCGHDVVAVGDAYHRQAYAVVGHALVNLQFVGERAVQGEVYILLVFLDGNNGCKLFDDSGKHDADDLGMRNGLIVNVQLKKRRVVP